MSVLKLYQICLEDLRKISFFHPHNFNRLPHSCLRDILPYLTPLELECLDFLYDKRSISINDLWRRHFELIWSLSRDDKDAYDSIFDIPYKRLYFEYLFHDTQILQLGIYTHISQINQSKSILHLPFIEHLKYNLARDSIIYCSRRRLTDENENLLVHWNHKWNQYIKRFILVPHVWNLAKIDPLLIDCFTENVTEIVLSGYPTDNDYQGMKFILDILTRGHINNIILKFPSYCLMNILLPLLIYPRSYSLSYLSMKDGNNSKELNLFSLNRKRKLCLEVQIHTNDEHHNLNRVLSTNYHLNKNNENDNDDNSSIDTTHAIISDSTHSFQHSSSVNLTNDIFNIPSSDHDRTTIVSYERLLPYLNRSRTVHQYSTLGTFLTPIRHLSTSQHSVPRTNLITEPLSSSDSNLFQRHTTVVATPLSSAPTNHLFQQQNDTDDVINNEQFLLFHLTQQNQINHLTTLSIYYVSSFEIIEMIGITLLSMNQIQHLTLVNFAIYSSKLETSLITLCIRSQLQSLHLTSISLAHGAIGFLLHLFHMSNDQINLKHLRLDTVKTYALLTNNIYLSDVEQAPLVDHSSLEQFTWRERHMQYIHMRLLYKLLPNTMAKLQRLELSSILECIVFDQHAWCQSFLHHISDVRLRNFRIRSINLQRFFSALNTPCLLRVFHFERIGLTWTNNQSSTIVYDAFTSLILHATHLVELSLAYNNLNNHFIQWFCQMLLSKDVNMDQTTTTWWSIVVLNLTFNLISSESMRRLIDALKEYKDRWRIGRSPIRRIDILGNALEMREIPNLKKQFHALGCDLIL